MNRSGSPVSVFLDDKETEDYTAVSQFMILRHCNLCVPVIFKRNHGVFSGVLDLRYPFGMR